MSELKVMIDDRARLLTAVLAAGKWPEWEQAKQAHAVHPHAKQTRQFVRPFARHKAVIGTDALLAVSVPMNHLFAAALGSSWPDFVPQEPLPRWVTAEWLEYLAVFAQETAVATQFWPQHEAVWQEASADLHTIFDPHLLPHFVGRVSGQPQVKDVYVLPNLVYPALSAVHIPTQDARYLLLPPPKAVGESPPWPYREGPDWVLAESAYQSLRYALQDTLVQMEAERRQLTLHAAIILFLEEALGEADALAYMVRVKRQFELPTLPLVVEELRDALAAGRPLTA